MDATRVLTRIAGVGWQVTSPDGRAAKIVLDDGTILWGDRLVGTAEAAAIAGVRPPNFVRDWASRADFPAPVATLSSGRIWRESDVRTYARRRHRPRPGHARLLKIARKVAWWDAPERTLERPLIFVARVLAHGSAEDIADVEVQYGPGAMREAIRRAPASLLDDRARNYWELVLRMPHEAPPPPRQVTA
ncbi:MAG TPA: hypothetical protein VNF73_03780 [Candidatus Saccharimonadales bacterium]|nr:hypothetical protein [Candidatus Saccharimonadales bacterium]